MSNSTEHAYVSYIQLPHPRCILGERDCLLMHLTRCLMFRQVTVQYTAHASKVDKDAAWEDCRTLTNTWFSSSTQDCLSCDENLRDQSKSRSWGLYVNQFKIRESVISSKATITWKKLHSQAVDTPSLTFAFVHNYRALPKDIQRFLLYI